MFRNAYNKQIAFYRNIVDSPLDWDGMTREDFNELARTINGIIDTINEDSREWKAKNVSDGLPEIPPKEYISPFYHISERTYNELVYLFNIIEKRSKGRIKFNWTYKDIKHRKMDPSYTPDYNFSTGGSRMRPHIPKNKQGASTFVLACIDPRFTKYLADYLIHDKEIANDYDLFALAGAELGANQTKHKCWKTTMTQHIDVALDLHNIKQLLVFSHMDCGAYKVFKDLEKDDNHKLHEKELKKLHKFIGKKYPQLIYKGFIMDTDGSIHKVKC